MHCTRSRLTASSRRNSAPPSVSISSSPITSGSTAARKSWRSARTSSGTPATARVSTPQPCSCSTMDSRRLGLGTATMACTNTRPGKHRSMAGCGGTPKGSSNQNVEPAPATLWTPIRPPINSTIFREMARPRPVPPNLRDDEVSACTNGWNNFCVCSLVKPIPVSVTSKRSRILPCA